MIDVIARNRMWNRTQQKKRNDEAAEFLHSMEMRWSMMFIAQMASLLLKLSSGLGGALGQYLAYRREKKAMEAAQTSREELAAVRSTRPVSEQKAQARRRSPHAGPRLSTAQLNQLKREHSPFRAKMYHRHQARLAAKLPTPDHAPQMRPSMSPAPVLDLASARSSRTASAPVMRMG